MTNDEILVSSFLLQCDIANIEGRAWTVQYLRQLSHTRKPRDRSSLPVALQRADGLVLRSPVESGVMVVLGDV